MSRGHWDGEKYVTYQQIKYAEGKAIRDYIKNHPEEVAAAQAKVAAVAAECARQKAEIQRAENLERLRKDSYRRSLQHALMLTTTPSIKGIDKTIGMLAFRQWDLRSTGDLHSVTHGDTVWKDTMIADVVPTNYNTSGLYCFGLNAIGMMHAGSYFGACNGLLELRGHIEIHGQENIIRAEWAKILAVFVTEATERTYLAVPNFREKYPTVPLFLTTKELVAKYLLKIVMWQETKDSKFVMTDEEIEEASWKWK